MTYFAIKKNEKTVKSLKPSREGKIKRNSSQEDECGVLRCRNVCPGVLGWLHGWEGKERILGCETPQYLPRRLLQLLGF